MDNSYMEKYKSLLTYHDWFYDYSDDHNVWTKGAKERAELRALQQNLDPDYEIWNTFAPDDFKFKKN